MRSLLVALLLLAVGPLQGQELDALHERALACLSRRRALRCRACIGNGWAECPDGVRGCETCLGRGEVPCGECRDGLSGAARTELLESFGIEGDPLKGFRESSLELELLEDPRQATSRCLIKRPGAREYLEELSDWWWDGERWQLLNIRDAHDPVQRAAPDLEPWERDGFRIEALARYQLTARVLGVRAYDDRSAGLLPIDLAVAWGELAEPGRLAQIEFEQRDRWYYWEYTEQPWGTGEMIPNRSANMHCAPATPELEERLRGLQPGQMLRLAGYLIRARRRGSYISSLSRRDRGDGSCEVIWIDELELLGEE